MKPKDKAGNSIWVYVTLVVMVIVGFLLRLPSVTYNLPVAVTVDERTGLWVLYRFENGSLNPSFFDWPTFYYYLTYFVTKPFASSFQDIVLYGRVVNLLLGCLLIILVFILANSVFLSSGAGLIASFLVMCSPILVSHGSYILTDILLAVLSFLALLFFTIFFRDLDYKYWFAGILAAGLAIATKYTAVLIVPAYVLFDLFFSKNSSGLVDSDSLLERRFSVLWLSVGFLAMGMLCLASYFALSSNQVLHFFMQQGDFNSSFDLKDIRFVESWRLKFLISSILLGLVFLSSVRFATFFSRFCYLRPYLGLVLTLLVFVLGSPFVLISWPKAIYDLGTVLKMNELSSSEQQWLNFFEPYFDHESIVALVFFLIGVYWLAKHKRPFGLLVIYLAIYYAYHGSATRVYPRYWKPILPVVFVVSAYGILFTANLLRRLRWGAIATTLLILVIVGLELRPKFHSFVSALIETTNSMYGSYYWILNQEPDTIYYPSYMPDLELRVKGFDGKRVPENWITTDAPSLLQQMEPNDVLVIDGRLEPQMNALLRQGLSLEWSSEKDQGQYIFRKATSN